MSQLRGSQHYIWSLSDVLGRGATGDVYKARHKHTGELYAVKTFNNLSFTRSPEVQKREFEVLRRLDHDNIVRLLAIEEESNSRNLILVMELCTGGSLFNQLDDPENAYGIEEIEFKRVLMDVANGMKHLRDQGVVHRDIKPGNIMRYISDDGRSVYKLIDFGAARELQEEEQFVSLYGTEEYLFPDMYERAVLKRSTGKQFSASVDLWSIGVTLYHVATGQLPFRPYGGRRNKETMYRITSEKASGVISGVQYTEDGRIEFSKQLPRTCRLSQGMRQLITPVLARLLEGNHEKTMKFESYFDSVKDIIAKHVIYVFDTSTSRLLHVYINKDEKLARFQELIAEQTDIRTEDQQLLFENHEFEKLVKSMESVSMYPPTSMQNPIYLFSSTHNMIPMPVAAELPDLPVHTPDLVLDNDAVLAKNYCSVVHFVHRLITELLLKQQLISKAAKMYLLVLSREIEHMKDLVTEFCLRVEELGKRLQLMTDSSKIVASIISSKIDAWPDAEERQQLVKNLGNALQWSSVETQKQIFRQLQSGDDKIKQHISVLSGQVSAEVLNFLDTAKCSDADCCIPKADVILKTVKQTVADFARDKTLKKLSFNEEQIHKFDKYKMKLNSEKAVALVNDVCFPKTKHMFDSFHKWYRQVWEVQRGLHGLQKDVMMVNEMQDHLCESLNQMQDTRPARLKPLLDKLGVSIESTAVKESEVARPLVSAISNPKTNKELRELVKLLRTRVSFNNTLTLSAKQAVDEQGMLIHRLHERHYRQEDQVDNRVNYAQEEPLTLVAPTDVPR